MILEVVREKLKSKEESVSQKIKTYSNFRIPFGKYKGKTLDDIANDYPSYFIFLTKSEASGKLKNELDRIMSNKDTKNSIYAKINELSEDL